MKPDGSKEGNLYFELNKALRKRGPEERRQMMMVWGTTAHYLLTALRKLPVFKGMAYRGYPDWDQVAHEYTQGRTIQWGAFSSTTTSLESAKEFTDNTGIVFKITVCRGYSVSSDLSLVSFALSCGSFSLTQIHPLSFFPDENEIILCPSDHFVVNGTVYYEDTTRFLNLTQMTAQVYKS